MHFKVKCLLDNYQFVISCAKKENRYFELSRRKQTNMFRILFPANHLLIKVMYLISEILHQIQFALFILDKNLIIVHYILKKLKIFSKIKIEKVILFRIAISINLFSSLKIKLLEREGEREREKNRKRKKRVKFEIQ